MTDFATIFNDAFPDSYSPLNDWNVGSGGVAKSGDDLQGYENVPTVNYASNDNNYSRDFTAETPVTNSGGFGSFSSSLKDFVGGASDLLKTGLDAYRVIETAKVQKDNIQVQKYLSGVNNEAAKVVGTNQAKVAAINSATQVRDAAETLNATSGGGNVSKIFSGGFSDVVKSPAKLATWVTIIGGGIAIYTFIKSKKKG